LFVGALDSPTKRVDDLLSVFSRLKREFSDLSLLIVGDGSMLAKLKMICREQAIDDVIFAGRIIDGVSAYFMLGDIFVLPGLGGLAISQAMCHALPIITAEADGCEVDLVEEGRNGIHIRAGQQDQLADAIRRLLVDDELRAQMAKHSEWIIRNRFNIHTYMANLVAALEYAAKRPSRCPPGTVPSEIGAETIRAIADCSPNPDHPSA
jgi:glycosyltransferase involved in cell wall biosynthesis